MAHRRSRRLQGAKGGPASGEELLCLFLELNGLDLLGGEDRGSLALVAAKFHDIVAQQVTRLDLTVAGIASAQQQLEWQHRRQQGAISSSTGSRRQQQQRGGAHPNLLQHLASRMPQLSQLKLFYNTIVQPSALGAQLKLISQVPQLTCLSLRDAASCAMPSSGLGHISSLTGLNQLNLLVQSTGQRPAFTQAYALWKANIMRSLAAVTCLTALQHLQLRFICGERGYFYSQALLSVAQPLQQLTHLDLGYVDVPAGGLEQLAGLSQLCHCILYGRLNKIVAQDFIGLSSLQRLERLEMFHDCPSHLDDPGAGEVLVELGAEETAAVCQAFAGLSQLSWLNLPMVAATKPLLPLLHKLPALEQLYLQSISREQAVLHLAKGTLGPGVRVLQVDNVKLDTERLDKIASLTQLRQLTLFNLQLLDLGSMHALSKLSKLSLEQFCFDALVADNPEHIALFDNRVLRSLAPAWPRLHSLHISYTALPPTADLVLDAFRALPALRHLSLYASPDAALDQHTSGKPLMLDCSSLPAGLQSLYLCSVTLEQPEMLPSGLLHLWLSDAKAVALPPGSTTLLDVVSLLLPDLQTLVLRLAWPPDDQVLRAPVSRTADLELLASRLPHLTCLGLSLPVGVGQQLVDLRALAPLTNMRQLLLDYCCDQAAPANGAAAAAAPGEPQQQQHQQQAANGVPPLPPPPAQAAAAAAGGGGGGGGGVVLPAPPGGPPFAFAQHQAGGPAAMQAAVQAAVEQGGGPLPPPQQQQQQQPAAVGIGAEMALMHMGGGVAEAVRQIGWALRMLGAADVATVQGVEAAINACIAARGQLMGGHGPGAGLAGLQQARAATQALLQQAQGPPAVPIPGADVAAGTAVPVLATAVQALQTAGLLLQQQQQQQQQQQGLLGGGDQHPAAAAAAGAGGGNAAPPPPAAAAAAAGAVGGLLDELQQAAAAAAGGGQGGQGAAAAAAAAAPQAANAGPAHPAGAGPGAAAAAAAGAPGGDGSDDDEDQDGGEGDDGWVDVGAAGGGAGPAMEDLQVNWGNPNAGMGVFGPGPGLKLDSELVVQQLAELCVDLRRLQGVWLSDNVLGHYPGMPLQQLLAAGAPRVVVRAAVSDWFWGTNFPIGSSLEGDNPLMWWMFTPWSIL